MARERGTDSATAIAFAPGSVGNVAVGFDILGHSVPVVGDRVLAKRIPERIVRIAEIVGVTRNLPLEADRNTAGMAVQSLMAAAGLDHGFELIVQKGIPLGSGLGGSAASAVAGVVAANALLQEPLDTIRLLKCAMHGEAVASGAAHVDNIAPSLVGGLVLTVGIDDPIVKQIPVPKLLRCVLVRPHMELPTRASRGVLQKTVLLSDVVWQEANLAGFLTGCFTSDLDLIRASFSDVMIEPQRKSLIPGFEAVQDAALANGALGCSISGGGPTMFAWSEEAHAEEVRRAMVETFRANNLQSDAWVVSIVAEGARLVDRL